MDEVARLQHQVGFLRHDQAHQLAVYFVAVTRVAVHGEPKRLAAGLDPNPLIGFTNGDETDDTQYEGDKAHPPARKIALPSPVHEVSFSDG
jgi:hypothetical protein